MNSLAFLETHYRNYTLTSIRCVADSTGIELVGRDDEHPDCVIRLSQVAAMSVASRSGLILELWVRETAGSFGTEISLYFKNEDIQNYRELRIVGPNYEHMVMALAKQIEVAPGKFGDVFL